MTRYRFALRVLMFLAIRESMAQSVHGGAESLYDVTTLSPEAAEALAKREVWLLFLPLLTTLTPEVAEALAKCEGELSLYGLTTLSDEAAATLRANPKILLPK